jgi:hypothetical protein
MYEEKTSLESVFLELTEQAGKNRTEETPSPSEQAGKNRTEEPKTDGRK